MPATKILWGQVITVLAIIVAAVWIAKAAMMSSTRPFPVRSVFPARLRLTENLASWASRLRKTRWRMPATRPRWS